QLAREVLSEDLEEGFLTSLEKCVSNIPEQGNGRKIYDTCVKPAMVDLIKVGAHYAVSSLFEEYTEHQRIYCYDIGVEDRQSVEAGRVKLVVGKAQVFSTITLESARLSFAVLHFGDHNLNAGVREYQGEEAYKTMLEEVTRAFEASEHTPVIRLFARHFGDSNYSLKSLFKDEQRKILDKVLESTIKEIQEDYRRLHERNYSLMRFLIDLGNPVPKAFHAPVEIVLNANLLTALTSDPPDLDAINSQMEEAVNWKVDLDMQGLGYLFTQTMERMITRFTSDMQDLSLLKQMIEIANITRLKPFEMNLWKVQNHFYKILQGSYGDFKTRAESGDKAAQEWVGSFKALGELLSINVK
ncbi:MAG: DUF3536 domain-containing protein, partial [Dehalococcoidia bacterium]|nr:DUF3536 domain-containing protein [Dehalococcoidia bacterium]